MAVTIISHPQPLHPVYNPTRIEASSTNINEVGFRYVIDVYNATTNTKIFEQRSAPRPSDGNLDIDLSKSLSDFVDKTIPFSTTALSDAAGSWLDVSVEIGEEYSVSIDTTDSQGILGNYVILDFASNHGFVVGDQVRITPSVTYNDGRDNINGLFTVTDVPTLDSMRVELQGITNPSPVTFVAAVRYADNRRTIFRDLDSQGFFIFNGALRLKPFKNWDWTQWDVDQVSQGKFLTNIPRTYRVKPDSDVWLNMFGDGNDFMERLRFENSNGDVFSANLTDVNYIIGQVACGLGNHPTVTALTGSLPVVKDDTTYVDMWLADSSGARITEIIRYEIDRRCTIEDYDILFMDRMGSFVPFAFQLRSMEKGTIRREQFNKDYGFYSGGEFDFNLHDSGFTTYHIDFTKSLDLNTNWMDDAQSVYFEELLSSPYTYLKVDGDYYSVSVQESSFETQRQKNKNLIRKTVTVTFDINEPVNI